MYYEAAKKVNSVVGGFTPSKKLFSQPLGPAWLLQKLWMMREPHSNLYTHIGGHHPMLYFTSQITRSIPTFLGEGMNYGRILVFYLFMGGFKFHITRSRVPVNNKLNNLEKSSSFSQMCWALDKAYIYSRRQLLGDAIASKNSYLVEIVKIRLNTSMWTFFVSYDLCSKFVHKPYQRQFPQYLSFSQNYLVHTFFTASDVNAFNFFNPVL